MLPSRSRILAEAINTKILTKNHPDSPHFLPDSPHSHLYSPHFHPYSRIPTLFPCITTLIHHVPTLIPRVPTLIRCVPIIPLTAFPDSPFRLLQIDGQVIWLAVCVVTSNANRPAIFEFHCCDNFKGVIICQKILTPHYFTIFFKGVIIFFGESLFSS